MQPLHRSPAVRSGRPRRRPVTESEQRRSAECSQTTEDRSGERNDGCLAGRIPAHCSGGLRSGRFHVETIGAASSFSRGNVAAARQPKVKRVGPSSADSVSDRPSARRARARSRGRGRCPTPSSGRAGRSARTRAPAPRPRCPGRRRRPRAHAVVADTGADRPVPGGVCTIAFSTRSVRPAARVPHRRAPTPTLGVGFQHVAARCASGPNSVASSRTVRRDRGSARRGGDRRPGATGRAGRSRACEAVDLAADRAHEVGARVGVELLAREQLEKAAEREERRAQLVRGVRDELAPRAVEPDSRPRMRSNVRASWPSSSGSVSTIGSSNRPVGDPRGRPVEPVDPPREDVAPVSRRAGRTEGEHAREQDRLLAKSTVSRTSERRAEQQEGPVSSTGTADSA